MSIFNPPVLQGGPGYIFGMRLTNDATTPNNILDVATGACIANDNANYIVFQNGNITADITTNGVAATGVGGLDTGTVAASKFYYVYAIGQSSGYAPASVLFSLTSPANGGPVLPTLAGETYDVWRRIGGVSTDSSSNIRKFIQYGFGVNRTTLYDPGTGPSTSGVVIPSSGTSGSTTYVNVGVFTTLVPQSVVEVLLKVALTPNSANNVIYLAPATIDNGTTATVGSTTSMSGAATGSAQVATMRVPVDLPNATQISGLTIGNVVTALYATTSASDAVVFLLQGYVDTL